MIWNRLTVLRALFPRRAQAIEVARRWSKVARDDGRLQQDIIRLGGVLQMQAVTLQDGIPELDQLDPHRLAYEAGRRDFAVQLLALMGTSFEDMNTLMEDDE
jgi:hypothetical protein